MNIKTCNMCSYFIDDLENGAECGNPNGCIYDKEEQNMKEKEQNKTENNSSNNIVNKFPG